MFLDLQPGSLTEPLGGRSWDPRAMRAEVARRVDSYRAHGLRRGDRVLLLFGNRLEFFAELLALWELGACAVPVDGRLTAFEVGHLARAAAARFAVVDGETAPGVSGLTVLPTSREAPGPRPGAQGHRRARLDDEALILFTSGSTGAPKGVLHTQRTLRARWIALGQSLGLAAYRRTLCLLPTHFGHGLICNCLYPWLSGQDLFVLPPFKADLAMRLGSIVDEHGISFLSSVPAVWQLALRTAEPPRRGTLERVHVGSAPLSAGLWGRIQEWAGTREVFNAYGITETASWVAGTTGEPVVPEDGLVGPPWGAVIKILSTRETDRPLAPDMECARGQPGYVWLNTPALMRGYLDRDDLTDAVVRDGWFMTGDIGILDDRGRLFLRGRERDEINKGGLKVFPADIEAVVERCAGVRDVCAFGFADRLYGENIGLAVVLESADPGSARALYDWMRRHLAEHKMPVRWHVLEEIPRTSRWKVNRAEVMRACLEATPYDLAATLGDRPAEPAP